MAESESSRIEGDSEPGIAIIGLAGRFPGAASVTEFWQNLIDGVESVSFFSDEELEAGDESISRSLLDQPNFVRAKGVLDGVEEFDAAFFGFNPREAELLDPQHRLFLECAWHALEDAGYDSLRYSGRVGVYGGTSTNTYLLNIYSNRSFVESIDPFQLLISSDKDFLTTRVSYKLGLSGPSIAVQTACSTSLVAVHLAPQLCDAGVGQYEFAPDRLFPDGARLTIWREGDGLVGHAADKNGGYGAFEVYPLSETNFFFNLTVVGVQLSLVKNDRGEVTSVIRHVDIAPDRAGKKLGESKNKRTSERVSVSARGSTR